MSDSKKEWPHLRLVSWTPSGDEKKPPEAKETGLDTESRPFGLQLVDDTYVAGLLQRHATQGRFMPPGPGPLALERLGMFALTLSLSAALCWHMQWLPRSNWLSGAPNARQHAEHPQPEHHPNFALVKSSRVSQISPPKSYTLEIHNLPGALTPPAHFVAVAVVDHHGLVTWLAPAKHPAGEPWPLPAVQTLALPDGPLLSGTASGTRVVALFLRKKPSRQAVLAWAEAGAGASPSELASLDEAVIKAQVIAF